MLPVALLQSRWRWGYLVLSLGVLLNVVYTLPGTRGLLTVVRLLSGEGVLVAVALVGLAVVLVRAEIQEGMDDGAA